MRLDISKQQIANSSEKDLIYPERNRRRSQISDLRTRTASVQPHIPYSIFHIPAIKWGAVISKQQIANRTDSNISIAVIPAQAGIQSNSAERSESSALKSQIYLLLSQRGVKR